MREFIDEGDLDTFEGWMRYQAVDVATLTPDECAEWEGIFQDVKQEAAAAARVGLMQLRPVPGEFRYAVAVADGESLWLVLWVRRSRKGEVFVMVPRGEREWDLHTSYHLDGTLHLKSRGKKTPVQKQQPLGSDFKGVVSLGTFSGYAPRGIGAVCDPKAFSEVITISSGILGPAHGGISVDLCEPGYPLAHPWWTSIAARQVFRDCVPHVAVTVGFDHTLV